MLVENVAKIPMQMIMASRRRELPMDGVLCLRKALCLRLLVYIFSLTFARRRLLATYVEVRRRRCVDELGLAAWQLDWRKAGRGLVLIRSSSIACIAAASVPAVSLDCLLRANSSPLWFFYFSPYHHIHLAICCLSWSDPHHTIRSPMFLGVPLRR